jgi:cobalt-zinc-cadmium efflux system protein
MHTHSQHCTHHHHSHSAVHGKKLLWVMLLNFMITLAEIAGGLLSNSLSLLSDAVHNLGDSLALFFAWTANRLGNKKANRKRTFGYKRIEILTAFFNALALIVICLFLFIEAYHRLMEPQPIKGALMLTVAIIGLITKWVSVLILQKDKNRNINVKAAYLHLMGDTLSSVAVIMGGVAIWFWGVVWLDPVITVLVGIYIIHHTWSVLKQAIDILMQGTPPHIDIDRLVSEIGSIPGVRDIHHLHLWQLNDDQVHFEAHINAAENIDMVQATEMRGQIEACLRSHGIGHSVLQIGYNCCEGHEQLIVDENRY